MNQKKIIAGLSGVTLLVGVAAVSNVAQAFDFGNMMNPSRWFDSNNDRYYDRGYYGGYGPYGYGPYGYGGPYGGPWGGYPGYGGWGYPGYGGYGGAPSTIVVNPSQKANEAPAPHLPE